MESRVQLLLAPEVVQSVLPEEGAVPQRGQGSTAEAKGREGEGATGERSRRGLILMNGIITHLGKNLVTIAFLYLFYLVVLKLIIRVGYRNKRDKIIGLFWFIGLLVTVGGLASLFFVSNFGDQFFVTIDALIGLFLPLVIPIHPSKRLRWELTELTFFFFGSEQGRS